MDLKRDLILTFLIRGGGYIVPYLQQLRCEDGFPPVTPQRSSSRPMSCSAEVARHWNGVDSALVKPKAGIDITD